jgi:hypothetical protein
MKEYPLDTVFCEAVPWLVWGFSVDVFDGDSGYVFVQRSEDPARALDRDKVWLGKQVSWPEGQQLYIVNTLAQTGKKLSIRFLKPGEYVEPGLRALQICDSSGVPIDPATADATKGITALTPTLYPVTLTVADTEYPQALPTGTKKVNIHARTNDIFRLAFVTGKVAAPTDPYMTIPINSEYCVDSVYLTAVTVYLASSVAGTVIEIEVWV